MRGAKQSLSVGLRRRWKRGGSTALSVMGAIWLFTELLTRISAQINSWLDANGSTYLSVAFIAAAIGFLAASYEARQVSFTLPNTATTLTLKFSDIFEENAHWLIGVNEFFDSTLGNVVADTSLHGKVISNVYRGDEAEFRRVVDRELTPYPSEHVDRVEGQTRRYELGTTIAIPNARRKIFLVAISKTDPLSHRSSSSVPVLWDALSEAMKVIDKLGGGEPLAIPLIGNGRASLNIPPQHLLRIISLKLTELGKHYHLPKTITINLSEDCFDHLDLVEIKRGWSIV